MVATVGSVSELSATTSCPSRSCVHKKPVVAENSFGWYGQESKLLILAPGGDVGAVVDRQGPDGLSLSIASPGSV
uniref:Uncharacterized protein n=1 Tax=Pyricularia oryzae (strain P131) TaxID=1143193 RepID=L7ITH0_PYRO1